jgi:hypothetical protein
LFAASLLATVGQQAGATESEAEDNEDGSIAGDLHDDLVISSESDWRVGVGFAGAYLPHHGLRSVQIRFKGGSISSTFSHTHRSATNGDPPGG